MQIFGIKAQLKESKGEAEEIITVAFWLGPIRIAVIIPNFREDAEFGDEVPAHVHVTLKE